MVTSSNMQMKREAMQAFWKKAGIEPANTKAWKPTADLLAFLQSSWAIGLIWSSKRPSTA